MIVNLLQYADKIVVLNDGKIVDDGSYTDILERNMELIEASTSAQEEKPVSSPEENLSDQKLDKSEAQVKDRGNEILQDRSFELLRQNGTWDAYKYYIQRAGPYISIAFFGVLAIQAFTAQYSSEFSSTILEYTSTLN